MSVDTIAALIQADVPVMLWGPPGTGKSALISAMARKAGAHCEVLIGSTLDPVDVGGYLIPHEGQVHADPPPWARRLRDNPGGWLFLDELSCAPASVRAALLRVIHDRHVAGLALDCRVLAASNDADTAAAGGELDPATSNRLAHIEWKPTPKMWCGGEASGWGTACADRDLAAARASVTGFIFRRPELLLQPPDGSAPPRGWPSPRAWSHVVRACAKAPHDQWRSIAAALVGAPAAAEWSTWRASMDLPDPEHILAGAAFLPTRPDQLRASLIAVATAAILDVPDRDQRLMLADGILGSVDPHQAYEAARVIARSGVDLPQGIRDLGMRVRGLAA